MDRILRMRAWKSIIGTSHNSSALVGSLVDNNVGTGELSLVGDSDGIDDDTNSDDGAPELCSLVGDSDGIDDDKNSDDGAAELWDAMEGDAVLYSMKDIWFDELISFMYHLQASLVFTNPPGVAPKSL